MASCQKKPSESSGLGESSMNLDDSSLVPLRSCISTCADELGSFQIEANTLLDPNSCVRSDSSLSYPSRELSLLEQVMADHGKDGHGILKSKKGKKDMTIDCSFLSSPGSPNSTANLTLPKERRQTIALTRRKKHDLTMDFTMNGSTSSCDNQENESPVLPSISSKPLFKRPKAKRMSIRFEDVLDSDSSKVSIHDDSLTSHEPVKGPCPLKSSLRTRAAHLKNMSMDISQVESDNSDKSIDQESLAEALSACAQNNDIAQDESLPKLEPKSCQRSLKASQANRNITFDFSVNSSKSSEKSMEMEVGDNAVVPEEPINERLPSKHTDDPNISTNIEGNTFVVLDQSQLNEENQGHLSGSSCSNPEEAMQMSELGGGESRRSATFTLSDSTLTESNLVDKQETKLDEPSKVPISKELAGEGNRGDNSTLSHSNLTEVDKQETKLDEATKIPSDELAGEGNGGDTFTLSESSLSNGQREAIIDEKLEKMPLSKKRKGGKNRITFNFTMSDSTATDITSPNMLKGAEGPLLRKKDCNVSIPQSEEVLPNANDQEVAGEREAKLDEEHAKVPFSKQRKGEKKRITFNFTMSDSTTTDITSPNVMKGVEGPLRKILPSASDDSKGTNVTSIPSPASFRKRANASKTLRTDTSLNQITHVSDGQLPSSKSELNNEEAAKDVEPIPKHETTNEELTSFALPKKYTNPLSKKRQERNKLSIPFKLDDTVVDSELSNKGNLADCDVDSSDCSKNETSVTSNNSEAYEPAGSSDVSSSAVSLVCSLDDLPRSSNDRKSISFCSSRKLSLPPLEMGNVTREMSPSLEQDGIAVAGDSISFDELHLELEESLNYSGLGSSEGADANNTNVSLNVDNPESVNLNRSVSSHVHDSSGPVKSPQLLRRSKRVSKNVTITDSYTGSDNEMSRVAKKSFEKTKSRANSIAISEATKDSSCVSDAKAEHSLTNETEGINDVISVSRQSAEPPQNQDDPQIQVNGEGENSLSKTTGDDEHIASDRRDFSAATKSGKNLARIISSNTDVSPSNFNNASPVKEMSLSSKAVHDCGESLVKDVELPESVADKSAIAAESARTLPTSPLNMPAGSTSVNGGNGVLGCVKTDIASEQLSSSQDGPEIGVNADVQMIKTTNTVGHHVNDNEADGFVDQLRSSLEPYISAHSIIRPNCSVGPSILDNQDSAKLPHIAVSPGIGIVSPGIVPDVPETVIEDVIPVSPENLRNVSCIPPATQTATSLNLHLTTFNTEADNATAVRSLHSVTQSSIAPKESAFPREKSIFKSSSGANKLNSVKEMDQSPSPLDAHPLEGSNQFEKVVPVMAVNGEANIGSPHPSHSEDASLKRDSPSKTPQQVDPNLVNKVGPVTPRELHELISPPSAFKQTRKTVEKSPGEQAFEAKAGTGIDDEPKQEVPRKSKRKSVGFKPPTENLYHSPPDLGSFQCPDQNDGDECPRIQMTTEISEIAAHSTTKRPKRLVSSTPMPTGKKHSSEAEMLASAQPTEFLVPLPTTKRVSIQPVPEIIPHQRPEGEDNPGSTDRGSSYDLSCENSLDFSEIPKDVAAPKRRNFYHSTPIHRPKASIKKRRMEAKQDQEMPSKESELEKIVETQVVNHSVQTSRNLRSRSKISLESSASEAPEPSSQSASVTRRSERRNTSKSQSNASSNNDPVESPARIAIQDNTIVSTRIESHSRTRGSRSRSTVGSAMKSYDSHRKMTSRRLFDEGEEMDEGSSPSKPDVPTSPTSDQNLSASSIARSYEPSIAPHENSVVSSKEPDLNGSYVSSISTAPSSIPSFIAPHRSLQSELSSVRLRTQRHKQRPEDYPQPEPPKPRSKFAISKPNPSTDLSVIYPSVGQVRKRKRTPSTAAKLFNPGVKWKKSKLLYAWLKKKLEPKYKLLTNSESERLVLELHNAFLLVSHGHSENAIDSSVETLKRLEICSNQLQLWAFFMRFMPINFVRKVVPLGGAFGEPWDPDLSIMPDDPIDLS